MACSPFYYSSCAFTHFDYGLGQELLQVLSADSTALVTAHTASSTFTPQPLSADARISTPPVDTPHQSLCPQTRTDALTRPHFTNASFTHCQRIKCFPQTPLYVHM